MLNEHPVYLDHATHTDITLLAGAWGITRGEGVRRLVESFKQRSAVLTHDTQYDGGAVAVHAIYGQVRIRGRFPPRAPVGPSREDFVLETVYWDAGTARLLPRLLRGRTRDPVFVPHRRPGPGKAASPHGVSPDTGLARALSTPPCAGRGQDGTCTSTAIPPSPTAESRVPPC